MDMNEVERRITDVERRTEALEDRAEKLRESEYRRGYSDGWIQALSAFYDLMNKSPRQVAYDACYDHWERTLIDWVHGDCAQIVLPPEVKQ